jgi:hypothetical protein
MCEAERRAQVRPMRRATKSRLTILIGFVAVVLGSVGYADLTRRATGPGCYFIDVAKDTARQST